MTSGRLVDDPRQNWPSASRQGQLRNVSQEVTVTAIAHAISRAFPSSVEFDSLKLIVLFCGAGLLLSVVSMIYGLDLGVAFF
jgi:hypothetical protein